jgi:NAD(P)-dependent dehydrogenase (short-subunit alcohol dehydrogenase family)
MSKNNLTGKVALITGGGRGIGRAAALELAQRGADIAVAARSQAEIEAVVGLIHSHQRRAAAFPVDLSDSMATTALVAQVEQALGPISILVNNAGMVGPFGPTASLDADKWEQAIRINLIAPFLLTRAVLPGMLAANWGRIVNVSSGVTQNPTMQAGAYAPSKAGLDTFTLQLGSELSGTNVAATAIYPGTVDTAMSKYVREQAPETLGASASQRMQAAFAEGRLLKPETPALLITAIVLATDSSLNGRVINIQSDEGRRLLASLEENRAGPAAIS